MRKALPMVLVVVATACGPGAAENTTTTTTVPETTTTTVAETTTTTAPPPDCPLPPYEIGTFPPRIADGGLDIEPEDIAIDPLTSVPGVSARIWLDAEGQVALTFVRGTLPIEEWPGERGVVIIDGVEAVAGQMEDGSWQVAWFEQPGERCDQYVMYFTAPVDASDVEATLLSMDRVAG